MTEIIEQLLIKRLQEELSPEEEIKFLAWLSESEENAKTFFQYKILWQARKINTYSNPCILPDALANYNQRIDLIQSEKRRLKIFKIARYAALIIALVSLPALYWYYKTYQTCEKLITETVAYHGEVKVINLSDGTRVWLNSGSTISYPAIFVCNERTIQLDGEAFLEVKKDPDHPFIVKTQTIQIKVLGTSFNVNTRCEGNTVQTVLVEGSVMLLDEKGEKIASLTPGQMAQVENNTFKVNIIDVKAKDYIAWQLGVVFLEKASLDEIISKIEEVYKINIQVDTKLMSQNLNQKRFNFVFRKSQSMDTVLNMLKFIAPVKYVKNGKNHNPEK